LIRKLWNVLVRPSSRFGLGTLLGLGLVVGALGLAGTQAAMHATSTDEFCLSCHELAENVGKEYEGTIHHTNAAGYRVTCEDCHVPEPLVPKLSRKLHAVREIYHHVLGTIDTPEKFDEHRMEMAMRVWEEMNANDSRECRACHRMTEQTVAMQSEKARQYHTGPLARGKTCIDCHKGDAHELPSGVEADEQLEGVDF
jgi:nitrate/TMAO reductase-like tetraheme cytochrome c subunit